MLGKRFPEVKTTTYRMRNPLTRPPSTPVTNDGPIANGKVVAFGFSTGILLDVDGCGASNDI